MRNGLLLPVIVFSLLLFFTATPVHADTVSDFAQSASMDVLGFDITDSKPSFMKSTQDWINEGNSQKARCEYKSAQYNEHIFAYVSASTTDPEVISKWKNPSVDSRNYLISTGFHVQDPEAGRLYNEMLIACAAADEAYRPAYSLTDEDDYEQHAEIFDEAAGVYDAVGNKEAAEEVRDAADVARGHAEASTYLPLPWWMAVLGAAGGAFVFRRVRG
jgi:hypothetical protein